MSKIYKNLLLLFYYYCFFRRALAESLETLMDICNQFNSKRSNSAGYHEKYYLESNSFEDKERIRSDVFGSARRVRCNSQVDELGNFSIGSFSKVL